MIDNCSEQEKFNFSFLSFRIWGLCIFQFLMRASINIFFVTSQTTFFTVAGVDKLPYVYTAMNIVYISLQFFSINKLRGASRDYLKYLTWVFLFFLFCRFILFSTESAAVTVFYLLLVMIFDLFFSQFFNHFVNDVFPLQEAKSYLPIITGFGSLSFIVSGFFIRLSLNAISLKTLAMAGTVVFTAGIIILMLYPKAKQSVVQVKEDKKHKSNVSPTPSVFSFSSLGRLIIAITFLNMLGKYWMDFQYSRAITQHYPSPEELAGFIAIYSSVTDSLVLISQLGFAGFFFKKAGIINSTRLLPAIVLPMCIITALKTGFWWVIATQFLFTFLVKSFYNSAFTLLYSVFPSDERMKLLGINGLTASIGAMLSGVSLIIFQSYLGTSAAFFLLAIVFGAMLYLCFPLESGYKKELERTIARNDSDSSNEIFQAILANKDQKLKQSLLKDLIARSTGDNKLMAIRQTNNLQALEANEILLPLTENLKEPKVQSLAAKLLAANFTKKSIEEIKKLCISFEDKPRVLANFLEGLGTINNNSDLEKLFISYLSNKTPRIRAAAIEAILQTSSSELPISKALNTLRELLFDKHEPENCIAALSAFEKIELPVFIPEILQALNSPNEKIAIMAIKISARFPAPEIVAQLDSLARNGSTQKIMNLASQQKQRIELNLEQDIAGIIDSLSENESIALKQKLAEISGDTISLIRQLLKVENIQAREAFCNLLTMNQNKELSDYLKQILPILIQRKTASFYSPKEISDNLSLPALQKLLSTSNLNRLLEKLLQKNAISEFRFILYWEMFACFLDSAIKAQNSSPEAVGDDNINHKNKRLEVLVGFLSLDSENPQKVLEAINAFSRDDQFYTSTGLEYLESVLPPGMPANFVKILSAGTSKTKFLKEFQNIFPLTEDQLKILAANNKKPGKCP